MTDQVAHQLERVPDDEATIDLRAFEAECSRLMDGGEPSSAEQPLSALSSVLMQEFIQSRTDRQETAKSWLRALRAYKGKYEQEEESKMGKRSRAYVRKTRVKVKTIVARMMDLVFPAGKDKNWSVTSSPDPDLAPEAMARVNEEIAKLKAAGAEPDQAAIKAIIDDEAKRASIEMEMEMDDQLAECRYKLVSQQAINSGALFGTGIIKGPLVERKIRSRFKYFKAGDDIEKAVPDAPGRPGKPAVVAQRDGWVNVSETFLTPFVDFVPVWRFYPDMSVTDIKDCRFVYELHRMTRAQMAALANRGGTFNSKIIKDHILANPDGCARFPDFEEEEIKAVGQRPNVSSLGKDGRYEVLERWGYIEGAKLRDAGVNVPEGRLHETFFSNIWLLSDGSVIRAVLQPINGVTWPYRMFYFDKDESSIFGEGLPAIMADDQKMLNAAVRLILDNAAITAGPQIEVIESLFSNLEDTEEMSPWKIWRRTKESPGIVGIRPIELPSRLGELTSIAALFDGNLDEITAIPRYMSGENATSGAAGTASGMSMLLGAANIVSKDLVTNWEEGVSRPFLTDLYAWNMQFNPNAKCKGDFSVVTSGIASLVAKEVRAQQLNDFAARTNNPTDLPLVNRPEMLRQIAEAVELKGVVKTDDELRKERESDQAMQMAKMQQDLAETQLRTAQANLQKAIADTRLIEAKAQSEGAKAQTLYGQFLESLANIEKTIAETVDKRVSAAFSAIQTGQAIVLNPSAAPAGDEVLASAGWVDQNGSPSIADVGRFKPLPNPGAAQTQDAATPLAPAQTTGDVAEPGIVAPAPQDIATMVDPPQGPDVGIHQGIETTRADA